MAAKSIIEVEINDADFLKFKLLFDEYTEELRDMPDAWKDINEAAAEHNSALNDVQSTLGDISTVLADVVLAQNEMSRSASTTNTRFTTLGKTVKGIAGDVFGIATSVLKIGAVGLGLGAIAGGFGFDALAGAALNRQRGSNSLGLTPGQLSSFQINAQQFLGTGALSNAAGVQLDPRNSGYLSSLGIGYDKARNESASDLAFQMLESAVKGWRSNPRMPLNTKEMIAYQALGGSVEDVRNATMDPNFDHDIKRARTATNADAGALGFDRQSASEWITLKKALDSAGVTIESGLIKSLAPLAPEIAELSKEFTGLLASFLSGDNVKTVIADMKDGLHEFGDFVKDTDWKAVGANVGMVASEIAVVAQKLSWLIPHDTTPQTPAQKAAAAAATAKWGTVNYSAIDDTKNAIGGFFGSIGHGLQMQRAADLWVSAGGDPMMGKRMAAIADAESSFNPNATHKNKDGSTDYGMFQINSVHAAELKKAGLTKWQTDPFQNAQAALLVSGGKSTTPWATWNEYASGKDTPAARTIAGDLGTDPGLKNALKTHGRAIARSNNKGIKVTVINPTQARIAIAMNASF